MTLTECVLDIDPERLNSTLLIKRGLIFNRPIRAMLLEATAADFANSPIRVQFEDSDDNRPEAGFQRELEDVGSHGGLHRRTIIQRSDGDPIEIERNENANQGEDQVETSAGEKVGARPIKWPVGD
jgi:hypothetical protein